MEPKVELYTAICTAMDRKDAKTAIWEILSGYAITATAACSSLEDSIAEFLAAKRADSLSENPSETIGRSLACSGNGWICRPLRSPRITCAGGCPT